MEEPNGLPGHPGDVEGPFDHPPFEVRAKDSLGRAGLAKRITKAPRQDLMRRLVRPHVQRPLAQRVEAPHIVQPHDMVGVRMRENDRVDHVDAMGDALETQLRRRIDEDPGIVVGDDDGWPHSLVTRIGAGADRTMAADHGDAGAGAAAEKEQFDLRHHRGL